MQCNLYQRTGAIYKENKGENESSKKTYSINWFFVGDDRRIYYHATYCLIQKILRCSSSSMEATRHFKHFQQKSIDINRYDLVAVKPFNFQGPIVNKQCIQIREKQGATTLKLLALVDEDIENLVAILKGATMKATNIKRYSSEAKGWGSGLIEEEEALPSTLLQQLPRLERSLSQLSQVCDRSFIEKNNESEVVEDEPAPIEPTLIKVNDNQHYVGQVMSGMPHGGGKEVLLVDGLSFNGNFKHGKKHGRGYITNSNLDTLYCEFIEDEICGI